MQYGYLYIITGVGIMLVKSKMRASKWRNKWRSTSGT